MTIIRLFANDQDLSIGVKPKLASGVKNSVLLSVAFSGHWKEYLKSAVFFTSWDKTVYEIFLDNGKCTVPHEVLVFSGYLYIGVRGVNPDTQEVKTSDLVKLRIEKGAPSGDATTKEPTPDVYQQILAKLAEISQAPAGSPATIGSVDLRADRWVSSENLHSQVVSISGVTENSQVDITPSVEQLVVFYEKDLTFVTENDGGTVTVYAIGQRPENDYTIQVTITEVNA